jgi:hypothetical protein
MELKLEFIIIVILCVGAYKLYKYFEFERTYFYLDRVSRDSTDNEINQTSPSAKKSEPRSSNESQSSSRRLIGRMVVSEEVRQNAIRKSAEIKQMNIKEDALKGLSNHVL